MASGHPRANAIRPCGGRRNDGQAHRHAPALLPEMAAEAQDSGGGGAPPRQGLPRASAAGRRGRPCKRRGTAFPAQPDGPPRNDRGAPPSIPGIDSMDSKGRALPLWRHGAWGNAGFPPQPTGRELPRRGKRGPRGGRGSGGAGGQRRPGAPRRLRRRSRTRSHFRGWGARGDLLLMGKGDPLTGCRAFPARRPPSGRSVYVCAVFPVVLHQPEAPEDVLPLLGKLRLGEVLPLPG